MKTIDLNCDMGESFGAWKMGDDAAIMPLITSANIAGGISRRRPGNDPRDGATRRRANGVAIGAHPSLPDLAGFGRRAMKVSAREVYDLVLYQAGAVEAFARAAGAGLHHVKAHGALYNMAATDATLADAIAAAVKDLGSGVAPLRSGGQCDGRGSRTTRRCVRSVRYLPTGPTSPTVRSRHETSPAP